MRLLFYYDDVSYSKQAWYVNAGLKQSLQAFYQKCMVYSFVRNHLHYNLSCAFPFKWRYEYR